MNSFVLTLFFISRSALVNKVKAHQTHNADCEREYRNENNLKNQLGLKTMLKRNKPWE